MSELIPNSWTRVEGEGAAVLERELKREICDKHILYNKKCIAFARGRRSDDVLFSVEGAAHPYYWVHLTHAVEKSPTWPTALAFSSLKDFSENWERVRHSDDPSDEWRLG